MENNIFKISLDMIQTLGFAVVVLLFGKFLTEKISFLRKFCIPAPVIGGLLYAIITLIAYKTGTFEIALDMSLKNFFMVSFFTTVGFNANFSLVKKAGMGVVVFFILASFMCIVQNFAGIGIATLMGQNKLLGIALGSVPLTGGHGTSGTFGPELELAGLAGAKTITLAAATFGLVSGSLIGGPTGNLLIKRHNLKAAVDIKDAEKLAEIEALESVKQPLDNDRLASGFFQMAIAMGLGSLVTIAFSKLGIKLPIYIGPMLIAAIMSNVFGYEGKKSVKIKEIGALGEIFLNVFLAYALIDLRLWELADLALPFIVILFIQVFIMFLFAYFVTFTFMNRDYDAAVISAGHCGFGLGATPNGVANMSSVVKRHGMSPKAFLVLPIVGGLFIDFTNSIIITTFIEIVKKFQ